FISILLSGIYLANFINAITVTKNSGEVLDNSTWGTISSLTDKIDITSSDIKLNGKLYVTGELCSNIGGVKKCLGSCESGYHWEQASLSCVPNNCSADTMTSNTYNYSVPELNNGITSAVLTSTNYQDIANGKKYYTQAFLCNNGVIETSGSEGNNIVCNSNYTWNGSSCITTPACPKSYNGKCYIMNAIVISRNVIPAASCGYYYTPGASVTCGWGTGGNLTPSINVCGTSYGDYYGSGSFSGCVAQAGIYSEAYLKDGKWVSRVPSMQPRYFGDITK
ncbi:MAG: hypothetical protein N4A38_02065, partial [Candidatus Gracilibacteria bacterium]|nr:hypothetical protein [Candidatus Gracilibacteria bacterium]